MCIRDSPWFVFFQKDSGLRPAEPPASMRLAMLVFAFLCIALGVWPQLLYALLPFPVNYVPYTWAHVLSQLQLLLFSGLAFFIMLPYLKRTDTITLDTDWIWRVLLRGSTEQAGRAYRVLRREWDRSLMRLAAQAFTQFTRQYGQDGRLARTWSTRTMSMWVLVLLLCFLLLYYL